MKVETVMRGIVRHGQDATVELSCGPTEADHREVIFNILNCSPEMVTKLGLPGEHRVTIIIDDEKPAWPTPDSVKGMA